MFRALTQIERDMNLSFLCYSPLGYYFKVKILALESLNFPGEKSSIRNRNYTLVLLEVSIGGLMKVFSGFKREWLYISLKTDFLAGLLLWVEAFPY